MRGVSIFIIILLIGGVCYADDLPFDVSTEVVPGSLSESEMDAWLTNNQQNFDFYVEGRSIAEYRNDTQRKILQARKEAQEKIALIDEHLKEQLTGNNSRDKELIVAAKNKKQKVYKEEMEKEEQLLNRQLRREVAIMRSKNVDNTRIAKLQKDFRDHITQIAQKPGERINAAASNMPDSDVDLDETSSGRSKIEIDKNKKVIVKEQQRFGGEASDRTKQRLRSR